MRFLITFPGCPAHRNTVEYGRESAGSAFPSRIRPALSRFAFRGRIRIKNDAEVTEADFARYQVVLFGDPGSNQWIRRLNGKSPGPMDDREFVAVGSRRFSAPDALPALIYPSPLSSSHYVVMNSGITANWEDWAGDFSTPEYGDFAILRVNGKEVPDVAYSRDLR